MMSPQWFDLAPVNRLASRASSFASNVPGMPHTEGFASELIFSLVIGATFGLLTGFLVSKLVNGLVALQCVARYSTPKLAVVGSVLGALLSATLSLLSDSEQ